MFSPINNSDTDISMLISNDKFLNYGSLKQNNINLNMKTKSIHKKKKAKPFTKEEDQLLLLQVLRIGKRFEAIARNFPRRSKHELKNRYYTNLRDRENEIFNPTSSYYISHANSKKNKDLKTTQNELNLELENISMDEEYKQILGKFIVQVSDLFSFIKTYQQ